MSGTGVPGMVKTDDDYFDITNHSWYSNVSDENNTKNFPKIKSDNNFSAEDPVVKETNIIWKF